MTLLHKLTRMLLLLCMGVLLPVAGGCATDKQVISQAADMHSGLKPAVISDPELANYIQQVGNRIIASAKQLHASGVRPGGGSKEESAWMFSQNMQFHFVASDTLNAFTTGGEHMYIYTKLFTECDTEDELAAVMAHEYAHVYGRHVQSGINRQYTVLGAAAAAGVAGYALGDDDNRLAQASTFAGTAALAGQFIGMGYTRGDEREADDLGFQFYTRAGWDPKKFADFFRDMIKKGYDTTPEMMSDHPSLASRVEATEQDVSKLPADAKNWRKAPVADRTRLKQLQAKATRIAASMPQDDAVKGAKLMLASFPSCVTPEDQPDQKQAQARLSAILERNQKQ